MNRPVRALDQGTSDPLLTVRELAELLQRTPEAIYQMRYQGTAPRAVKVGRSLRFKHSVVEAWLVSLSE